MTIEIKNTISLMITQLKKMKYLSVHLTKHVQDLYDENYKTLMKQIKANLNRWRDIPGSWIGRLNTVTMSILYKLIYGFNMFPNKILGCLDV